MRFVTFFFSTIVCVGMAFTAVHAGETAEVPTKILLLAREGHNTEAIALYESLADRENASIDVIRAVAGCYWRERQFDLSRSLYNIILGRQPNLQSLGDAKYDSALLSRDSKTESTNKQSELPAKSASERTNGEQSAPPEVHSTAVSADEAVRQIDTDATLQKELSGLKTKYSELVVENESQRKQAENRIEELVIQTESALADISKLKTQLEKEQSKEGKTDVTSVQIQQQLEKKILDLDDQIKKLSQEIESAHTIHDAFQEESGTKINDLLDAVATEKIRRETAEADLKDIKLQTEMRENSLKQKTADLEGTIEEAQSLLRIEQQLAEKSAAESKTREAALLAQIDEIKHLNDQAQLQLLTLEQNLATLQGRFDEMSATQPLKDDEIEEGLETVQQSTIDLALQEIELLDREYSLLDEKSKRRQTELLEQIEAMEKTVTRGEAERVQLGVERDAERAQRVALEALNAQRNKELLEANQQLEEAESALSRQYAAIRQQIQTGVAIRLENEEEGKEVRSSDLIPLIGKLEEATESAGVEVRQLRELIAQERAKFVTSARAGEAANEALKGEVNTLTKRIEEITSAGTAREASLQKDMDLRIAAMTDANELRVVGLKGEIEGLKDALAAANRVVESLRADLKAEREDHLQAMTMARATELALHEKVTELETAFSLPETREEAVASTPGTVGGEPVDIAIIYREIMNSLPADKAGAVEKFEALPENAEKPIELLKAMGTVYREQGNYEAACRLFQLMLARAPGDLYAERKLVMTLFDMGLYDQALDRLAGTAADEGRGGSDISSNKK